MQERYSEEVKVFGSSAAAGCNELSAGAVMCAYLVALSSSEGFSDFTR